MRYECWKHLDTSSNSSIEYSMDYLRMIGAEQEAMMALVFKYTEPLCSKLLNISIIPTLPNIRMSEEVGILLNMSNRLVKLELMRNNNIKLFV